MALKWTPERYAHLRQALTTDDRHIIATALRQCVDVWRRDAEQAAHVRIREQFTRQTAHAQDLLDRLEE